MENIIALIVIIIAVSSIFRKLNAKRKINQGAAPPGDSWVTKLNAFLIDIQRKIEEQSKNRTAGASGWDQLLDGGEGFSSPSNADEATLNDLVFEEVGTPPQTKEMPPAAPVSTLTTRSDKAQFVPGDIPRRRVVHAGKPSYTSMAGSRADLRMAVIWTEILGPPIALRDQFGDRR